LGKIKLDLFDATETIFKGVAHLGESQVPVSTAALEQLTYGRIIQLSYTPVCALSLLVSVEMRPYRDDEGTHFIARVMFLNRWVLKHNNPGIDLSRLTAGR